MRYVHKALMYSTLARKQKKLDSIRVCIHCMLCGLTSDGCHFFFQVINGSVNFLRCGMRDWMHLRDNMALTEETSWKALYG